MFILDDVLVKPFTSILDVLHTMALNELYDTAAIQDELKENRLLYEIGERSQAEYEERRDELEFQLEMAEQVKARMGDRIEVKG